MTKLHALDFPHPVISRFWSRVRVTPTCWEYTGKADFGNMSHKAFTHKYKHYAVHRIAYELLKGDYPPGYVTDHLCRNVVCMNPDHLEAVTNVENVMRGMSFAAQEGRQTHCKRGHLFDKANTIWMYAKGKNPSRRCLKCTDFTAWHQKRVTPSQLLDSGEGE